MKIRKKMDENLATLFETIDVISYKVKIFFLNFSLKVIFIYILG